MEVVPVTLEGRELRLEPLGESHASDLAQAAELGIFRYMPMGPQQETPDALRDYIEMLGNRPGWRPFAMVLRRERRAIGVSAYFEIRPEHRGLEIGSTWIARQYQGTWVNPEAKFLMLRHAFEDLGAIRVELKTDSRNLQSQRGIEKLGAQREGVLRNHMIMPDGYLRDTVVYSIKVDEWPQVKKRLVQRLGYEP